MIFKAQQQQGEKYKRKIIRSEITLTIHNYQRITCLISAIVTGIFTVVIPPPYENFQVG